MGQWNNNAWMTGTLPAGYNYLEVTFYAACEGNVVLSIDGVTKSTSYGDTVVYQQKYSAGLSEKLKPNCAIVILERREHRNVALCGDFDGAQARTVAQTVGKTMMMMSFICSCRNKK